MYLDFEDRRPDTPRVPTGIPVWEGVLISLAVHVAMFAALRFVKPAPVEQVARDDRQIQYVEVVPVPDAMEMPKITARPSDQERRSQTIDPAPVPDSPTPRSDGNSPEPIQAAPEERAQGPEGAQPAPPQMASTAPTPLGNNDPSTAPTQPLPRPASGSLGQSLRNLQRYLQDGNYDNPIGGDAEQGADIQFDSMGVDFGPWLRQFKRQVERNWLIPLVAETSRGRVVVEFDVLRNGTIINLRIVQSATIEALTISALNAIKLSNPTPTLPPEYPTDRIKFTVTFHYNEGR